MATSRFLSKRPIKVTSPAPGKLRKSAFAGLDTNTSVESLAASPYLRNARNIRKGSMGMRKGPGYYTDAQGETTLTTQTSTAGAANVAVTTIAQAANHFTTVAAGRLTRIDLNAKNVDATAPLIVEIWSDSSNAPSIKLASSSIPVTSFSTSYQYLTARFIEAPLLLATTKYWVKAYQQSNGTGTYHISSSSTYSSGLVSANSGVSWTANNGLNYKVYLSVDGGVLGGTRIAFSNGNKYDILALKEAAGTTGVYRVSGTSNVAISTGLSSSAIDYQFAFSNDILAYCNSYDAPRQWTETTDSAVNFGSSIGLSAPCIALTNHKNRWFFLEKDTNRAIFSEAGDIASYVSTNFIYIPAPKTGDAANSMFKLQDNLWFGTRTTKYVLYGADLASFVMRQSTATKGIINQNSVTVDGNFAYFASDDGIYTCNGATDELLSTDVAPDYAAIPDLTKSFIVVWQNQLRYYFAATGSTVCNTLLMLDLVNGGWWCDNSAYISRAFKYKTKGDALHLIECSSVVGQAYYAEQQYSDLGKPIRLEYFDTPLCFSDPYLYKQILFYGVRFLAEEGSYEVDCQMDKDLQNSPVSTLKNIQGSGTLWGVGVWGNFVWGQSNFEPHDIPVSGEYRWFQPRFVIEGADTPVELQGYTIFYLEQPPR